MKKANRYLIGLMVMAMAVGVAVMPTAAAAANFINRGQGLGDLFTLDKLFMIGQDSKTDLGDLFILDQLFPAQTVAAPAPSLSSQLSGRILLQVEDNGEAWYVDPTNQNKRIFLGGPSMAFGIMSGKALGVSNADFDAFQGKAPQRLSGRFLIKTEDAGKLYYVNPVNLSLNFVSGPSGAASLISTLGLGITNADLDKITVANGS